MSVLPGHASRHSANANPRCIGLIEFTDHMGSIQGRLAFARGQRRSFPFPISFIFFFSSFLSSFVFFFHSRASTDRYWDTFSFFFHRSNEKILKYFTLVSLSYNISFRFHWINTQVILSMYLTERKNTFLRMSFSFLINSIARRL